MMKGFSFIEFIVALALSASILSLVISTVSDSMSPTRKVISHQEKMESIFHTMDMLRADLTKCGMRLQEASKFFYFPLFENTSLSFKVVYGMGTELLKKPALYSGTIVTINKNDFFSTGKRIILFDPQTKQYEINEIKKTSGNDITLTETLLYNYPVNSIAIALSEVEYKLYSLPNVHSLKRKVNKGTFQPVIEDVTDFFVQYYPESNTVYYRIEINRREQIRGYVFMTNMMETAQ